MPKIIPIIIFCLKFPEEQEMSEFRDDHRNHLLPHELPWLSFLRHSISNQVPTFLAVQVYRGIDTLTVPVYRLGSISTVTHKTPRLGRQRYKSSRFLLNVGTRCRSDLCINRRRVQCKKNAHKLNDTTLCTCKTIIDTLCKKE